jgi:hypothetical protein
MPLSAIKAREPSGDRQCEKNTKEEGEWGFCLESKRGLHEKIRDKNTFPLLRVLCVKIFQINFISSKQNREEGIAMATDTLYQVTAEEEAYALQTSLMKGELDWRSGMMDARKEGCNEASLDIARNLKGMGLPISQIAEGTGLSPETIAQL